MVHPQDPNMCISYLILFILLNAGEIIGSLRRRRHYLFPPPRSLANQKMKVVSWSSLEELYNHETGSMAFLSKTSKAAAYHSNIERQNVSLVLRIVCDESSSALTTSRQNTDQWKFLVYVDVIPRSGRRKYFAKCKFLAFML